MAVVTLTALLASCGGGGGAGGGGGGAEGDVGGGGEGASRTPRVDLTDRVERFAAPLSADGTYREPSTADRRAVAEAVGLVLDGPLERARAVLAPRDYRLRTLTTGEGRRYAELRDATEDASAPRGWPRIYVDRSAPARWSVQIPHPVADQHTERLGAWVLQDAPGGVLVVAGAHRDAGTSDAADVAHRRDAVFTAVTDELTARGLPAVQLHGYADDTAPDHDVVASTGAGDTGRDDGRRLAGALEETGLDVCRAWERDCPLEGTENVQGQAADEAHVPFLHVEFAHSVRDDASRTRRALTGVAALTRHWAES